MAINFRLIVVSLASVSAAFASAQYRQIADWVTPYAVNNSGTVAGYDPGQYFLWSPTDGYQGIGGQTPGNGHGGIPSLSNDGQYVGGTSLDPNTGLSRMARYSVATGEWTTLGSLGSSSDASESAGFAMSSNGETVVGNAWINAGTAHAYIWNSGVGHDLGSMFDGASSRADGVSLDGSLIGGYQDRADGFRSAAIWHNGTEQLLEYGGEPLTAIHAVSADGNWAVGGGGYALNYSAYLWSPSSGLTALANPYFDLGYEMVATAVNSDCTLVTGYARDYTGFGWGSPDYGWMWSPSTGVLSMNDYAQSLGLATDDVLSNPLGISLDGRHIVGQGFNAQGTAVIGWELSQPVPEPAAFAGLIVGLAALKLRRRK